MQRKKNLLINTYVLLVNSYATQKKITRKQLCEWKIARKQLRHILRGDLWTSRGWWGTGGWFKLSMNFIYFCTLNVQDISFWALYDFLLLLYKCIFFGPKVAWIVFSSQLPLPTPLNRTFYITWPASQPACLRTTMLCSYIAQTLACSPKK